MHVNKKPHSPTYGITLGMLTLLHANKKNYAETFFERYAYKEK